MTSGNYSDGGSGGGGGSGNQLAVRQGVLPASTAVPIMPGPTVRTGTAAGTSLDDMMRMAQVVATSGLIPGMQTPSAVFTLMLICESEGLHPAQALKRYHVIEGRPTMRADAMQADFMRLGGLVAWERSDDQVCSARFIHPRYAPEPGFKVTVTLAELVESGVATSYNKETRKVDLKANYKRHPRQMLRARVISEGVRAVHPGVVAGIYAPEELDDYRDGPLVNVQATPAPAVPASNGGSSGNSGGGSGGQLEGSVIMPAQSDPGFAAKVQQAGTLGGVVRPPATEYPPVDYGEPSDPITDYQRGRLREIVQDVLKLSKEEWLAILREFGVAKVADLSAVAAATIIRRLEERADNDDPFGAGADEGTHDAGETGSQAPQQEERAEPSVAPGTPRDDDPRVPLINEALAIVGRIGLDAESLDKAVKSRGYDDIMEMSEDDLNGLIHDLNQASGFVEREFPDLIIPDATRPVTKTNARAQARAAKAGKDAAATQS